MLFASQRYPEHPLGLFFFPLQDNSDKIAQTHILRSCETGRRAIINLFARVMKRLFNAVWINCLKMYVLCSSHHHQQSLNREGRWGTTDDFATSFLHFPCSLLPSGTCRTPGLSIPGCCLPTSSFVRLVFFSLLLCLARWFWPDLMNRKPDHTTAVCISSRSSGDLRVVQLPAGSWHGLPRW